MRLFLFDFEQLGVSLRPVADPEMAHLICLKFPFLCIMVFSVTVRHCTPESEPVDIASDMYEDAARLVEATITEIDREKEIEQVRIT